MCIRDRYIGIMLLICLVISPLIHELSHILTFEIFGNYYFADISLFPVYGSLRILSPTSIMECLILLFEGVAISLALGFLFIYLGRKKENHLASMSGIGFLLNPSLSMFIKNDISTLFSFIGLSNLSILIGIFILGVCLFEFNYVIRILTDSQMLKQYKYKNCNYGKK